MLGLCYRQNWPVLWHDCQYSHCHPGRDFNLPEWDSTGPQTWLQLCNQPWETHGHYRRPWLESACHLSNTRRQHSWQTEQLHNSVTSHPMHLLSLCSPDWSRLQTTEECEKVQWCPSLEICLMGWILRLHHHYRSGDHIGFSWCWCGHTMAHLRDVLVHSSQNFIPHNRIREKTDPPCIVYSACVIDYIRRCTEAALETIQPWLCCCHKKKQAQQS